MGINIPVDFTGVEGGASVRAPEGDYVLKVTKLDKKNAQSSGNPMLVVTFEIQTGPDGVKGKRIIDRHVLVKDSLWTLRNMMEAMGYKVPSGPMKLKEEMLVGKKVGATLIDGDEYKSRINSEIADYLPVASVGNVVKPGEADLTDADKEEDDWLGGLGHDDEPDEEEVEETEPETDTSDEEDEGFAFDAEEDEDEDESLSFGTFDIGGADGATLKGYVKEATDAGWDLGLGKKPKVSEVRAVLTALLDEDEEDDEEELEGFSLDDVE